MTEANAGAAGAAPQAGQVGAGAGAPPQGQTPAGGAAGVGAGGAPSGNWYDSFDPSPEARQWLQEKKFVDPDPKAAFGTLMKSAMEADRLARSRNVMERPDPARLADWQGHVELGWKPDIKDYAFKPARLSEANAKDQAFGEQMGLIGSVVQKAAHEARVPLHAAQAVFDAVARHIDTTATSIDAFAAKHRSDAEEKLRTEWGRDFARNSEVARRAAAFAGIDKAMLDQMEAAVPDAPRLMAALFKIGSMLGEDRLVTSDNGMGALPPSIDGLEARMREIRRDPVKGKALNDPGHPDHKAVLAEYQGFSAKKAEAELAAQRKQRAA